MAIRNIRPALIDATKIHQGVGLVKRSTEYGLDTKVTETDGFADVAKELAMRRTKAVECTTTALCRCLVMRIDSESVI